MSGVQDLDIGAQIICKNCGDCTSEWAQLTITNVLENKDLSVEFCIPCLDVVSVLLDIDFDKEPEGMFRLTELGQIEKHKRDNN